jgi:GAF domain-containing protein
VKTQLRGEAIALAVAAVAGQAAQQRARVCFFALERDPPRLRPDRFAGRAGAPTATFTPETPGGAGALGIAAGAGWLYIPDTAVQAPPCWIDDERGYRSLLLGPVTTPEGPVGMLTIDAPDPNALDGIDMALVRLLATLLATALSM